MTDPSPVPAPQVVPLIPRRDFVVVVPQDSADLLDPASTRELRIQAYQRRNKPTLGPNEAVQVLSTLAEFAASGVVGNAAWAAFPSVQRYVRGWLSRPRARLGGADAAADRARELCPTVLGHTPLDCVVKSVVALPDGRGWRVRLTADGRSITVNMDPSGSILAIRIDD